IYKRYGKESIAFLTENPYRLSQDIWGIGFKIADQIAQNLGIPADSVKRVKAAMHHVILQEVGNGHLYVELDNLKAKTTKLLELDATILGQKMKNGLHELYNTNEIKLISHDNQHFVTSPQNYFSEKGCALKIQHLLEHKSKLILDTNKVYEQLRTAKGEVELNDDQQKGIMACLTNKVSIITGGPGTGKTTLIKQLLNALDLCNTKYRLAAPTGRAAKRMAQSTRRDAMTIHRLLEFDVSTYRFTKNEQNALNLDFLIIDEASMIDIFLANAILKAVPLDAHVVFIGDIHQLPSVGAGNFLNDLITSEKVNCTRLTKIFRQAQDSMIVVNAHRINQGEFPTSSLPGTRRDFIFIKEDDPANVAGHLQNIFTKEIKKLGFTPDQVNVLVPMNRGVVGTQTINSHLQEILNPATNQKHVMRHGTAFRVNDRVIQLRNNYDKLVFNGDMGTITEIDITEQQLHIQFGGRVLEYEFSELDELFLAYAITIHKSQGSEYPVVIIPIFMQHFTLLQRNLIYTAITRAKKLCIFIGQTKAIAMAIKNNKGLDRKTFLQQFLTSDLQAR
ncbi:ATP-dependent RecD-like DNA helicase, partial [Candidatus Dependentiae bacterium]|nr:ATP-dependent RecD-like DNA helicase [Candidatus Dependentiae bacterium]